MGLERVVSRPGHHVPVFHNIATIEGEGIVDDASEMKRGGMEIRLRPQQGHDGFPGHYADVFAYVGVFIEQATHIRARVRVCSGDDQIVGKGKLRLLSGPTNGGEQCFAGLTRTQMSSNTPTLERGSK